MPNSKKVLRAVVDKLERQRGGALVGSRLERSLDIPDAHPDPVVDPAEESGGGLSHPTALPVQHDQAHGTGHEERRDHREQAAQRGEQLQGQPERQEDRHPEKGVDDQRPRA